MTRKKRPADPKQSPIPAKVDKPVEDAASTQQAPASVQSVQPQDPSLTGASDSQQRTLLAANAAAKHGSTPQAQPASDTAAGLHSTGSDPNPDQDK